MKTLKVFLKPGWIITFLLVVGFSYLAFTVLSPWQLGKDHQIVERNEHVELAFTVDPQPYSAIFDSNGAIIGDNEWMRVEITGHYLTQDEVLLRMRPVDSTPAYQSLVPFQLTSGETILVNRGFEPDQAGSAPSIEAAPTGEVTIVGHARLNEATPQTEPMEADGYRQVYGINSQQISSLIDVPLARDYLLLTDDQPGSLNTIPVPKLDRGNHLSYGFQWIAFGLMAPLGLGYFVYAEIRERRKVQQEEADMALRASAKHNTGAGNPEPLEQAGATGESGAAAAVEQGAGSAAETSGGTTPGQPTTQAAGVTNEQPNPKAASTPSVPTRSRYGNARTNQVRKRDRRRDEF